MSRFQHWLIRKLALRADGPGILRRVAQLEEEVARYRETDRKRGQLHLKLKDRLKAAKREAAAAKQESRENKKKLEWVKLDLKAAEDTLRNYAHMLPRKEQGSRIWEAPGISIPGRNRSWQEKRAWKHTMRLGVLHQHSPQPFSAPSPPRRTIPANPPLISIVTPSWQQADYLEATLKSVLGQEYPRLEYIVMDGGSTDGSKEIIEGYAPRLKHWQSGKDGGQSKAIKNGFLHATGEIMAWLNSDDLLMPNTLSYIADYFARHPGVDAVYGHRVLVNEAGHEIGRWYLPPHDGTMLLWADYIPQETLFWRRSLYEKCGGMDDTKRFAMDWDLLLRMQRAGGVIHRLPEFLGCFRVHESQKSQAIIHDVGAEEGGSLRMRELGLHFNEAELARRSTEFQIRALRSKRFRDLGFRSVRW